MFYHLFDVITIGLPFCVFKITAGLFFGQYWLIALGLIDLFINAANLFSLLLKKRRIFDSCLLAWVGYQFVKKAQENKHNWQELGESIDVLLSFIIVAFVIGLGHITNFNASSVWWWNLAVVLNVLGAGSARLIASIKKVAN